MKRNSRTVLELTPSVTGLRGLSFSFALIATLALPFFGFIGFIMFFLLSEGISSLAFWSTWIVLICFAVYALALLILFRLALAHWRNAYVSLPIVSGSSKGIELRLHLGKSQSVFVPWHAIGRLRQDFKLASTTPENFVIQLRRGYGKEIRQQFGLIEGQIGHLRRHDVIRYPGNVFEGSDMSVGEAVAAMALSAGQKVNRTKRAGGLKYIDEWTFSANK